MKTNKKGFTLVELVIVIAVIAILAAVLLPTFSGIITRAKLNAATQRAVAARDEFHSTYFASMKDIKGAFIYVVADNTTEADKYDVKYGFEVKDDNGTLDNFDISTTVVPTTPAAGTHVAKYGKDVIIVYSTAINNLKVA